MTYEKPHWSEPMCSPEGHGSSASRRSPSQGSGLEGFPVDCTAGPGVSSDLAYALAMPSRDGGIYEHIGELSKAFVHPVRAGNVSSSSNSFANYAPTDRQLSHLPRSPLGGACFAEANTSDPAPPIAAEPSGREVSNLSNICACINCLQVGLGRGPVKSFDNTIGLICRASGCAYVQETNIGMHHKGGPLDHERSHFGQPGKYACAERGCKAVAKKFSDLKRHYAGQHCTNPQSTKHGCQIIGCKYSGNNGFARKDKLTSHYKNMHEGRMALPGKSYKVIKPRTTGTT